MNLVSLVKKIKICAPNAKMNIILMIQIIIVINVMIIVKLVHMEKKMIMKIV